MYVFFVVHWCFHGHFPYLWPILGVLLFISSPTYLCFNIAYHQMCWRLGGLWYIFLQDIHILALYGLNGWKIIIDQIIANNWKGFWHDQVLIIKITLGHFFSSWGILWSWCCGKFNLFMFYLYINFFYINLKDICVYVM